MSHHTVSDAALEFVPLTTADRPDQQAISLWVAGEKVPNLRRISVHPRDLHVTLAPCRAVQQFKEMYPCKRQVRVELTLRKWKLYAMAVIDDYAETITWPSGVCEVSLMLHTLEPWTKENL